MKTIKLLIIAVATLVSGSAMGQKIVCPDVTFVEGAAELVFSIAENTDETATLAEFTLSMPAGVTIKTKSGGKYEYERGDLMQEEHTVTLKDKTSGIYFLTKNEEGDAFTALNGELVTIPIVAGDNLADGTYQISVTKVNITNLAAKKIAKETSFTINVTKGATGINEVEADGMKADGKYLINGELIIKKGNSIFNGIGAKKK